MASAPAPKSHCAEEMLGKIRSLPPFHPVASQVLRLSSSAAEDLDIDEVAEIIESDQAFAAELLQMANSPLFGLQYTIRSSRHGVIVLGLERTKALAVRTAMQIYLKETFDHPVLRRCWLHSLACAEIAKAIAVCCGQPGAESAHTAGLLHDIGRVALLNVFRAEYLPILESKYEWAEEILSAEVTNFGFDHAEAGHQLCRLWNFPREIGDVASKHHEPVVGQENSLVNIVRLSCRIADSLGFGAVRHAQRTSYNEIVSGLPVRALERFRYSSAQLHQIITDRASIVPQ